MAAELRTLLYSTHTWARAYVNKVHVCKYLFCRWIIASLGDNLMFSLREKISTTQTPIMAGARQPAEFYTELPRHTGLSSSNNYCLRKKIYHCSIMMINSDEEIAEWVANNTKSELFCSFDSRHLLLPKFRFRVYSDPEFYFFRRESLFASTLNLDSLFLC